MLDRPDAAELLEAVARFLAEEVRPALPDRALAFRALIAANLADTIARERREGDALEEVELAGLERLFPQRRVSDEGPVERRAAIGLLNAALCERLRAPDLTDEEADRIRGHLLAVLRRTLRIVSPRFDPDAEVP